MKKAGKLMIALTLLLSPVMSIQSVAASEESSSVTVSYSPDKIYVYVKLKIEVTGNGEVIDMNQPIRNGSITYDIQEGDSKHFEIRPDDGYIIKSVLFSDGYVSEDVSAQLQSGKVDITVQDRNAELKVVFEKKKSDTDDGNKPASPDGTGTEPSEKPDGGKIEDTSKEGVQTGDVANTELILMLMGISLILMLIMWKKSSDWEEEIDTLNAKNIDERK